MDLRVTKMHALGNNYIYVEEQEVADLHEQFAQLAIDISDVRKGIGSDGMILIGPSNVANVRMRVFNADGSEAENCGNGLRCVAKYAYEQKLVSGPSFSIETKGGVFAAEVYPNSEGAVERVTVNMGPVRLGTKTIPFSGPSAEGEEVQIQTDDLVLRGTVVSVGNPHFVAFVEDAKNTDVATVGPVVEHHPWFPERINVEFVTPISRSELDFRVWERGSGITYACGTGACASVAAGVHKGLLDETVRVHLLGGDLDIEIRDSQIWMTGEAKHVFSGVYRWHGIHG
ncbi:diaminopimelate epimerase [Alicyclobacillus ferrooxydans]|uniref:diaminopimelate epimerase n=1 Tax=Alicyclobacillus ferrooxydans TaxID=471514 RepID=UPI000A9A008A